MNLVKKHMMLKLEKLGIRVSDTMFEKEVHHQPLNLQSYKYIFTKDGKTKNEIYIIDLDYYDNYGKEKIPNIDLKGKYVFIDNQFIEIIDYRGGLITLEKELSVDLVPYMSEIIICDESINPTEPIDDYVYIEERYTYDQRLNYNRVEVYTRYDIGVFSYNDENGDKAYEYVNKIKQLFDRDFELGDKNKIAFIQDPISFDTVEKNQKDRVVFGSIFIRTCR